MPLSLGQTVGGYRDPAQSVDAYGAISDIAALRSGLLSNLDRIDGAEVAHVGLRWLDDGRIPDAVNASLGSHLGATTPEIGETSVAFEDFQCLLVVAGVD